MSIYPIDSIYGAHGHKHDFEDELGIMPTKAQQCTLGGNVIIEHDLNKRRLKNRILRPHIILFQEIVDHMTTNYGESAKSMVDDSKFIHFSYMYEIR